MSTSQGVIDMMRSLGAEPPKSLLAPTQPKRTKTTGNPDYDRLYEDAGKQYGVDPDLLIEQARVESVNFDPNVVSGKRLSPKGAGGIQQFMPDTATHYGLKVGGGVDERFVPERAIPAGARMMSELLKRHGGNVEAALAAYNSGSELPTDAALRNRQRVPETRGYVDRITGALKGASSPPKPSISPGAQSIIEQLTNTPAARPEGERPMGTDDAARLAAIADNGAPTNAPRNKKSRRITNPVPGQAMPVAAPQPATSAAVTQPAPVAAPTAQASQPTQKFIRRPIAQRAQAQVSQPSAFDFARRGAQLQPAKRLGIANNRSPLADAAQTATDTVQTPTRNEMAATRGVEMGRNVQPEVVQSLRRNIKNAAGRFADPQDVERAVGQRLQQMDEEGRKERLIAASITPEERAAQAQDEANLAGSTELAPGITAADFDTVGRTFLKRGLSSSLARLDRAGAGLLRAADFSDELLRGLGLNRQTSDEQFTASLNDALSEASLRKKAMLREEVLARDEQRKPLSWWEHGLEILGGTPVDIARLAALSKLPGGAITGMATDAALQSAGRGASGEEVASEALKGGLTGAIFHGAGNIKAGGRIATKAAQAGTVGAGTTALDLATGSSVKDAARSGVVNAVFAATGGRREEGAGRTEGPPVETPTKIPDDHPIEAIRGKESIGTDAEGRLIVPNPENATGVSRVKPREAEAPDISAMTARLRTEIGKRQENTDDNANVPAPPAEMVSSQTGPEDETQVNSERARVANQSGAVEQAADASVLSPMAERVASPAPVEQGRQQAIEAAATLTRDEYNARGFGERVMDYDIARNEAVSGGLELKSKTHSGKEPYEMSRTEFDKYQKSGHFADVGPRDGQDILRQMDKYGRVDGERRWAIERALEQGKAVPLEVLADYPDIQSQGQPPTAQTSHKAEAKRQLALDEATRSDIQAAIEKHGGVVSVFAEKDSAVRPDRDARIRRIAREMGYEVGDWGFKKRAGTAQARLVPSQGQKQAASQPAAQSKVAPVEQGEQQPFSSKDILTESEQRQLKSEHDTLMARSFRTDGEPKRNAKPADLARLDEIRALAERHRNALQTQSDAERESANAPYEEEQLKRLGLTKGGRVEIVGYEQLKGEAGTVISITRNSWGDRQVKVRGDDGRVYDSMAPEHIRPIQSQAQDAPPTAQATPAEAPDASSPTREAITDAPSFERHLAEKFNLPKEQASAVAAITDARAETWARENGKDKSEWYKTRIAGIERGGETSADALRQSGGQTKTPEFRRWFGGSKAVDSTSEPLVVYHGTPSDFTEFNPQSPRHPLTENSLDNEIGAGFFTSSPSVAGAYAGNEDGANVMPTYVAIKRPLELGHNGTRRAPAVDGMQALLAGIEKNGGAEAWQRHLEAQGVDGIILRNTRAGTGQPFGLLRDFASQGDVYIPFSKTQIKSATGNRGTFDSTDPNILFQREGFKEASPDERKSLKIPPAWTDVEISSDPNARLVAVGRDAKGRTQRIYSAAHSEAQLVEKFNRQRDFNNALPDMLNRIESDIKGGRNKEEASVLRLIAMSGFRVGGEADTGGRVKAYGASTLRPEHVKIEGDKVSFDFAGKLGVRQEHEIHDADLARDLQQRLASGGEKLFNTNDTKVRNYLQSISGEKSFKVHDFRTWNATEAARKAIEERDAPKSPDEYWRARDDVGDIAARKIGDTRQIALDSYIDPLVFEDWRESAGVEANAQRPRQTRRLQAPSRANERPLRDAPVSLQQGAKGATEFLSDGRAIIHAFEKSDVSTAAHEVAHIFRRDLKPELLSASERWAGVHDGNWTRDAEEKFARGFERYLRDGQAPTEKLKAVFSQFKDWLSNIYQKIKGSEIDVKLNPEIRRVFDEMLGKGESRNDVERLGRAQRALPQSLEAAGMAKGTDLTYDPISNKETIEKAQAGIQRRGIDRSLSDFNQALLNGKDLTAHDTATGIELIRQLEQKGDHERAADVASVLSKKLTEAGQAVQAASIVSRLSPEGVLLTAQRRLPEGVKLTAEQSKALVEAAGKVKEYEGKLQTLEQQIAEMPAQLSKKGRRPRLETLQERLSKVESEARARLEARKQASNKGSQAGASSIPLDIADYAIIGASKLAQRGVSVARWNAEMMKEFGTEIRPHLQKIYTESYRQYDAARKEMQGETEVRGARREVPGPHRPEDLQKLIEQRVQARKDARTARAELNRTFQGLTLTTAQRIKAGIGDVLNVPRSLKSSVDLSAPRQAAMWIVSHPVRGARLFFGKQLKAMREVNYDRFVDELESDPDYPLMTRSGLALASASDSAPYSLTRREEAFMSRLAGRIPGVSHSERAYTTFMDTARASWFKQLARVAESKGKVTPEQYKAIANFVNIGTGRGNLGRGWLNDASPFLNALFFAPRFAASKVQAFDPRVYARLPEGARKTAVREAVTYFGAMATTAMLLKYGFGQQVGTNPDDSEFMKFRVGNTRYDLANGTGQYVTLAARLLKNANNKIHGRKDDFGKGFGSNVDRFLRYKYSPPAAFVRNVWEGKNAIGEPTTAKKEALELITPLFMKDLYDAYREEGLTGVAKTSPGLVGVGVSTYGPRSQSGSGRSTDTSAKF
jgi:DNA topoisomerase-1